MTLRTRLLLTCAVIIGIVAIGSAAILQAQRSYLVSQVDDQLLASRPFVPPASTGDIGGSPPDPPPRGEAPPDDSPISSLYLGVVEDGALITMLQGQLLDDSPDIDIASLDVAEGRSEPFTVDGISSETRFRVVATGTSQNAVSVIALPLDEVDDAVARLRWSLAAVAAVVTASLLLAVWWVHRLGLRPIAAVTDAADAIAAGDRDRRADMADERTEAGRLAAAFNVMLDERDASEEKLRRFVADASHELRTPLTSMRGYLEVYRDGGFRQDGQLDDAIRRMSQESARMNELVEDLLLLAKLDQHRPLRSEPVDLSRLLSDAAADASVIQPDRAIVVDADSAVETTGDPFRVQQVIGILVDNAIVHTDRTSEIRLSASTTADGVRIVVADDGPGIAADDAAKVFDRFYRGDHSRNRKTGGSGLGLAIARSIVEAHHGTITLTSSPEHGSTFTVDLPH